MKLNNQFKNKLKLKVKDLDKDQDGKEPDDEYEDPPPLELDEIKNAMKIIDQNHPMRHTPLAVLFPWACCCLRGRHRAVDKESMPLVDNDGLTGREME